eukprot:TRINITY_DN3572_c1_g1_i4.p1 TRINITY_DN3572_c1_g1~~TRINITY_DN3572_c1_g1_i4.p1  ORF type:complete len:145 (-),score=29.23 TRINITY_DN3572_c1_g1_i4:103-537(-)
MQGRENSAYSVLERRLLHSIFPGNTGFKSETGGIMANLRDLKVDTVRQYHRDFYRPDNLCLIVTGQVSMDEVIEAVRPMEERILSKGNFKPGPRYVFRAALSLSLSLSLSLFLSFLLCVCPTQALGISSPALYRECFRDSFFCL